MKSYLSALLLILFFTGCIKDGPLDPEADILTFSFPAGSQRIKNVEIYNDKIIAYPKKNVSLQDSVFDITVTPGAVWERIEKAVVNDTLFFVKVTSEDKAHTKMYSVIQVADFPDRLDFENWVQYSNNYMYENPKDESLQWFSSNNGTAIAWNSAGKAADEYPLRKTSIRHSGNFAAELRTMKGPGSIAGGVTFIPCLAGSLYLGGFDVLMGLVSPLKSTRFGIPFNSGKPVKLTGYYMYQEGTEDYINANGSVNPFRGDTCSIYSTLFKTDENVEYLYGDNVSTSDHIIARAEMYHSEIVQGNEFIPFELYFDYESFGVPFDPEELQHNEYKITIVFSSSKRGAYYEGRPGSRLIVDDVKLHYEDVEP